MDSDANIVIGLNEDLTNPVILNHITSENVETVFNRETLKKGIVFLFLQEKFMPLRQEF
jgi:mannose-6-phosphate isomerase